MMHDVATEGSADSIGSGPGTAGGAGLVTTRSMLSFAGTLERIDATLATGNMDVFARIDHSGMAARVGMELRPTQLIIFGNPRGGTLLMQDRQTAGIDLPLKALVWEDADGTVWVTYNDLDWLARRHGLGVFSHAAVEAIARFMSTLADAITRA